jgi:beta-glucosidase
VLLKNDGTLPLRKSTPRIAVIGPNADDIEVQLGNYHGDPIRPVTVLQGIRQAVLAETDVCYARGCDVAAVSESGFDEAVALAENADVVIFVGGLSQVLEGEDLQDEGVPPGTTSQGDRQYIELPPVQEKLLKALHATGKPVVLVLLNGSALAIPWADVHLAAIVEAWYPGEAGEAVADVLFGDHNPAGRLPLTFYRATDDLPPFESYEMRSRTYRYLDADTEMLYAFGYGLSYTRFTYGPLQPSRNKLQPGHVLTVTVDVHNTGTFAGDEVVQLYLRYPEVLDARTPRMALREFQRVHIPAGQTRPVTFELTYDDFSGISVDGTLVARPGRYQVCIGGRPPSGATDDRVLEMLLLE